MNRNAILLTLCALLGILLSGFGCGRSTDYRLYEGDRHPYGRMAVLRVPGYIEVDSFDGGSVENALAAYVDSRDKRLHFPAGSHRIIVRYHDVWDIDENDHERIKSKKVLMDFRAQSGQVYRIVSREPEDLESAREYAANFKVWIEEVGSGKKVSK
jgi:hypothetical protein